MIAIVDYGVGNLFSLKSSFAAIGADAVVTSDEKILRGADKIILPGVGAFGDAAAKLRDSGLSEVVREEAKNGKPLMGICLGMQMLLEKSFEYGEYEGLGLIKGEIRPISETIPSGLKIPHIGWNALNYIGEKSPIFKYISEGDHVYFVHSYYIDPEDTDIVSSYTEYGKKLPVSIEKDNLFAVQFHPEKSGDAGMEILKKFINL